MFPLNRNLAAVLATAAILALPAAAFAQAPDNFTKTAPLPPGQTHPDQGPAPLLSLGGVNAVINAPVQQPGDSGLAYRTFEGSPMTGKDALVAPLSIVPPSPE